jgi:hypothetical protein
MEVYICTVLYMTAYTVVLYACGYKTHVLAAKVTWTSGKSGNAGTSPQRCAVSTVSPKLRKRDFKYRGE